MPECGAACAASGSGLYRPPRTEDLHRSREHLRVAAAVPGTRADIDVFLGAQGAPRPAALRDGALLAHVTRSGLAAAPTALRVPLNRRVFRTRRRRTTLRVVLTTPAGVRVAFYRALTLT